MYCLDGVVRFEVAGTIKERNQDILEEVDADKIKQIKDNKSAHAEDPNKVQIK